MALSDGCHSNHYATEQTQWVKDGFECGSLRSQPGYDGTDRPMRIGCSIQSAHSKPRHTLHVMSYGSQVRVSITEAMSFIP